MAAPVWQVLAAWGLLRRHGILPVAGGWLDQTAGFTEAVMFLDQEAAQHG